MEREERRNGRLVGAAETSKERAKWRRLQPKNLSILGVLKRKEWSRCRRKSIWLVRQRRLRKEIKQSRRSRVPNREGDRIKVSESRTLAGERDQSKSIKEERVVSTVKEGRFHGGKGGQARRASLEQVEGSKSG